jgi:hypothetical protein
LNGAQNECRQQAMGGNYAYHVADKLTTFATATELQTCSNPVTGWCQLPRKQIRLATSILKEWYLGIPYSPFEVVRKRLVFFPKALKKV